jgi:hypothetical protein
MILSRRRSQLMCLSAILTGILTLNGSPSFADDPPPQDPTLSPSGGSSSSAVVADEDTWAAVTAVIQLLYPGSDYDTTCYYALVEFNLLPPAPPPPPPPPPCEDTCDAPVVATADQWQEAVEYVELFVPCADEQSLEFYILMWFNYLPPESCS